MRTHKARTLIGFYGAIVKAMARLESKHLWWRGHAKSDWNVRASLYHRSASGKEAAMTTRFRNSAKPRYSNCPPKDDYAGWLFLMQHYGLPTRLLDWSESPLVALFFAVEDERMDKHDGCVWALEPARLNQRSFGRQAVMSSEDTEIATLFKEAFTEPTRSSSNKMAAVWPDHTDMRHLLQRSTFTVHGGATAMNRVKEASRFMMRIRIPAESKAKLRETLLTLGISRSTLFPDLDNLAAEIRGRDYPANR